MVRIRRLVLDVLKPHHPDVVEFGCLLAQRNSLRVRVNVLEVDERTETLRVEVAGRDIDFAGLREAIEGFGASLHSIDEIAVEGADDATD
jgi:hypothetical protein